MTAWKTIYLPEAREDLRRLDGSTRLMVRKAIHKVLQNPLPQTEGGYGVPLGNVPVRARNYEVIRTATGEVADNLSEGEKNFIAFLYFQQRVFGNANEDADLREKIVVIDDPVSSMDSGTSFMVSAQVKRMIEICRNNADNRNAVVPGNFVKQIFILTHNAYFHREITYPYVKKYDFVSFYIIRKAGEKSSVKLCEAQNPNSPSDMMNVNPVKNSYASLWEEYKEVTSGTPLMNVACRIGVLFPSIVRL